MNTNPAVLAVILMVLSIVAYIGGITPMSAAMLKSRLALTDEESRRAEVELTIAQKSDYVARIERLEKTNAAERTTWMSPMLNSYAMRAKSILDSFATEAGLLHVEYEEGEMRALPVPREQLPQHRTARRSVRVKARADYAAAVSFMMRVEKELPLVAVQAFSIRPQQQGDSDTQDVEYVFEWPCEGEVIK